MRTIYIPCRANPEVLQNAVNDLTGQVDQIVVFNNTNGELNIACPNLVMVEPPDPLLYGQSLNAAVKMARKAGSPYCLWAHSDIRVKPGAIDALMQKYEELKDTKWGVIWTNYDSLCLFNPVFFIDEGVWDDVVCFPTYYGDNHRAQLMKLRGYSMTFAEQAGALVEHLGSHTIRMNPEFNSRNNIVFGHHGAIYRSIWGGAPGQETSQDPTARGLYPLKGG